MKKLVIGLFALIFGLNGCSAISVEQSVASGKAGGAPTAPSSFTWYSGSPIKSIDIVFAANFLLTDDGDVYAWGINEQGVLGLGLQDNEHVVKPAKVSIGEAIERLVVSSNLNTVYAIGKSGGIYAWGANHNGIFPGVDSYINPTPIKIELGVEVLQLSFSYMYLTVMDTQGKLYGCGSQMLGCTSSTTNNSAPLAPIAVGTAGAISSIKNASAYRSFLDTQGKVYVQGTIAQGVGGISHEQATEIPFPETIIKIGAMYQGFVALSEKGNLYFLGEDRFAIAGEVFSAEDVQHYERAIQITKTGDKVKDFEVSADSIIVRTFTDEFFTWGYNIGKNDAESDEEYIAVPNRLQIPAHTRFYRMGAFSGVAIAKDNIVYGWGSNTYHLYARDGYFKQYQPSVLALS